MDNVLENEQSWYHYTTFESALSILKAQTLRATHYMFLNDQSEMRLFDDKLIEHLIPIFSEKFDVLSKQFPSIMDYINQSGGLHKATKEEVIKSVRILSNSTLLSLGAAYITSFFGPHNNPYVTQNGLLSQWRGYGADGGVAIEFSMHGLKQAIQLEREKASYSVIEAVDVIYNDNEERFKAELKGCLDSLAQFIEQLASNIIAGKGPVDELTSQQALNSYLEGISRYKHRGFKEENERRIVSFPTTHTAAHLEAATESKPKKPIKYREKNEQTVDVPYIELFDDLPITRIIVGPNREKEYRAAYLRTLVKPDIKVDISDILYV